MNSLEEIMEWIKFDGDIADEPNTIPALLIASRMIIKKSTGVIPKDVQDDPEALELYKLIQKMIITNLYENRSGSPLNTLIIGLCTSLQSYKLVGGV